MARPANYPKLNSEQARYILDQLIAERKVLAADIRRHLAGLGDEVRALEARLAALRGAAAPVISHPVRAINSVVSKRRTNKALTPEARASRKLQGQYVGLIRQIPERNRKRYQEIAKSKGRESAIAEMKKTLAK